MYIHHIFVIHSFADGHLGCFSAAVSIGVHVSFQVSFLQIYVQEWDCRIMYCIVFVRTERSTCGYQNGSISEIHLLTSGKIFSRVAKQ